MVASPPEFDQVRKFWQNPRVEQALVLPDVDSSIAHVRMLGATGIIDSTVADSVVQAFEQIRQEVLQGKSFVGANDIDVQQGLERRLEELVGELASSVRIAKSRNDQIATDIRLWLRQAVYDIFVELVFIRRELINLAKRDFEIVMPGYTHMQPALPILLSHWWLANQDKFRRDFDRLCDLYRRLNILPLGAGALAGTNQPIDRQLVAQYLAFDEVIENSLDAVSDRDYLVEFAAFASLVGTHISQMSSELILWATQEFGFVRLARAFVSGSRSMPQKRNPALLEILRSRPSSIQGHLIGFLSELKALPIGFCQDLQECLPGLMDLVDNLKFVLQLASTMLPAMEVDAKRMKEMASADLTNASNAVEFLLARGISQEKASQVVEALVNYCQARNKYLSDLELNEWQQFSPAFDNEIYTYVTIEESVGSRSSFGGTSQEQVSQQLNRALEVLNSDLKRIPPPAQERLEARLSVTPEVN